MISLRSGCLYMPRSDDKECRSCHPKSRGKKQSKHILGILNLLGSSRGMGDGLEFFPSNAPLRANCERNYHTVIRWARCGTCNRQLCIHYIESCVVTWNLKHVEVQGLIGLSCLRSEAHKEKIRNIPSL